ncbi:thiamine phosphate synthase [Bacillus xiapuensis]|uniref:thiamine phosphate synthase n=1 Tax=Bacillus xiapuensis TaxID=2014075 RepID=UPI000C249EC1|nr:thiamine phosphate synthase [Bacillus xiapuensis]
MTKVKKEEMKKLLQLYFIMGSPNCIMPPEEVLAAAIEGGATLFQFREKGDGALAGADKIQLAKELQSLCIKRGLPFIVNDEIDLALKLQADGVHIGQDDEALAVVRNKLPDKIIGVSVHTMEEAKKAIAGGADYLGIGPIFATSTKADAKPVQGTKLIKDLRRAGADVPIVGIGGIHGGNAAKVIADGADGVSVITAISQAPSPLKAAQSLKKAVNQKR